MVISKRVISATGVTFGCDPELFIESGGQVVGSEKVIPLNGVPSSYNKIIMDGVQVEFNATPDTCRARMGNAMAATFKTLKAHLDAMKAKGTSFEVSFKSVVEVDKAELASLSEKSRQLGCAPSLNAYDKGATISVDPTTYRTRSAGGHIHLGLGSFTILYDERTRLVPLMDVLVGLPSVLVDRDPRAAERRKVYGRAGEHRLPFHGLEYRTLSNFWLRAYPLMGMVLGLSRLAVSVLGTTLNTTGYTTSLGAYGDLTYAWDAEKELLSVVDLEKVREAINTNDLALARSCWNPVRDFLGSLKIAHGGMAINHDTLGHFDFFTNKIAEKGIEYWFPQDPITHWCNLSDGHYCGFENFLATKVNAEMISAKGGLTDPGRITLS